MTRAQAFFSSAEDTGVSSTASTGSGALTGAFAGTTTGRMRWRTASGSSRQAPDSTLKVTGAPSGIARIRATMPGNNYMTPPTVYIVGGGGEVFVIEKP